MSTQSKVLDMTRVIGTLGAGIATGVMLGIPYIQFPSEAAVTSLTEQDRLAIWSNMYSYGIHRIVPLTAFSSLCLLVSSYLSVPSPAFPTLSSSLGIIAAHRRVVLASSGLTMLSILVYTPIFMGGTNSALVKKAELAETKPEVATQGSKRLREKWTAFHAVRIGLAGAAFVGAALELIAC